jgi:hypothetical protein
LAEGIEKFEKAEKRLQKDKDSLEPSNKRKNKK